MWKTSKIQMSHSIYISYRILWGKNLLKTVVSEFHVAHFIGNILVYSHVCCPVKTVNLFVLDCHSHSSLYQKTIMLGTIKDVKILYHHPFCSAFPTPQILPKLLKQHGLVIYIFFWSLFSAFPRNATLPCQNLFRLLPQVWTCFTAHFQSLRHLSLFKECLPG